MRRSVDIHKASVYSIVINGVQIVAVIAMALLTIFTDLEQHSNLFVEFIICLAALLVIWGAVVDIQQALAARRVYAQSVILEEMFAQMEALNVTLRAQRHDFMNHLQVVGSLVEMEEYHEAKDYIDRVYGDIQAVSAALKAGNPAINALLKLKLGESQRRGVFMEVHAHSQWKGLPVQGWEMCRVLGNLIDNGLDALHGVSEPRLTVTLCEDAIAHQFTFTVENNGTPVPDELREKIFQPGFTTKGTERGMGLFIVRKILMKNGGGIALETNTGKTVFRGWVPGAGPSGDSVP